MCTGARAREKERERERERAGVRGDRGGGGGVLRNCGETDTVEHS